MGCEKWGVKILGRSIALLSSLVSRNPVRHRQADPRVTRAEEAEGRRVSVIRKVVCCAYIWNDFRAVLSDHSSFWHLLTCHAICSHVR